MTNTELDDKAVEEILYCGAGRLNQFDSSQATHDIKASTLAPDGATRPRII